jgi:hypothetical protein
MLMEGNKMITNWYGNHKSVSRGNEAVMVPVGIVWNSRLVIQRLFQTEIAHEVEQLDASQPWVGRYQSAVSNIIQSLGDEDAVIKRYGDIAVEWNGVGPPEDVKRR